MERIISYDEIPRSCGDSIYLRMETDPKLYLSLLTKGYRIVSDIRDANESTIYVTGKRQDYECRTREEYRELVDGKIQDSLSTNGIVKPKTIKFNYTDLINYKYRLPFVLKNEKQNGGREKFLIATEEDYENLIKACKLLMDRKFLRLTAACDDARFQLDYNKYLDLNFFVQEYIQTPSEFNTTVRLLTSASNDLLYGALKYKKPVDYVDDTTLLGYLLGEVYPLSTKSIVSNTLSGGKNILLGADSYQQFESVLLKSHGINSAEFDKLIVSAKDVHSKFKTELGILCGFDFIYDKERQKWFLLEYHSRPMVGDYSKRQGILYDTSDNRLLASGRVRATALSLVLKKKR